MALPKTNIQISYQKNVSFTLRSTFSNCLLDKVDRLKNYYYSGKHIELQSALQEIVKLKDKGNVLLFEQL